MILTTEGRKGVTRLMPLPRCTQLPLHFWWHPEHIPSAVHGMGKPWGSSAQQSRGHVWPQPAHTVRNPDPCCGLWYPSVACSLSQEGTQSPGLPWSPTDALFLAGVMGWGWAARPCPAAPGEPPGLVGPCHFWNHHFWTRPKSCHSSVYSQNPFLSSTNGKTLV